MYANIFCVSHPKCLPVGWPTQFGCFARKITSDCFSVEPFPTTELTSSNPVYFLQKSPPPPYQPDEDYAVGTSVSGIVESYVYYFIVLLLLLLTAEFLHFGRESTSSSSSAFPLYSYSYIHTFLNN